MNNWTIGTDCSHWSGDINFSTMYDAGAKFFITKATDAYSVTGKQFEDSRFQEYCEDVFALGKLLTGCYHWLQASVDPTIAADFYLERYQRFDFDFPPILDFEEVSVRNTGLFSDYAWRAQTWCKRVEEVTGRKPIIYTAKWYTYYFTEKQIGWMGDYPLWVADYTWWANNVTKAPYYMPPFWDDWTMWQYSADGNSRGEEFGVQAASIDLNYYQGDYAQLLDWLMVDDLPDPPLTVEQRLDRLEEEVFGNDRETRILFKDWDTPEEDEAWSDL